MIEGFVEALRPFQVRGWALDSECPTNRLRVRVTVANEAVAEATADLFRQDLAEACSSDGKHAFILNVRQMLPLEMPDVIYVEVVLADGSLRLLPHVAGMVIEAAPVQTGDREAETTISGFFGVSAFEVQGWAFDRASPDAHLEVVVTSSGKTIGWAEATLFQDDLVRAGIGMGDHGFVLHISPADGPLDLTTTAAHARGPDGRLIPLGIAVSPAERLADVKVPQSGPAITRTFPIFPSAFVDSDQRPVIVLGAARSGTSAMAQALIGSGVFEGFEEGHFLDLLMPLTQAVAQFYDSRGDELADGRSTYLRMVPKDFVQQGLRHILVQAAKTSFPSGRWVDKTPRATMVSVAPVLREIFPQARFIYMRRRGIENLDSRLRKFPHMDFAQQCREWSLAILNWYAVAGSLSGAALEIDQVFMAEHPAEVADALARFLDLAPQTAERVAQALAFDQPERTGANLGAAAGLASLGWPADKVATFREICGPAMVQAGYSEDERYFMGDAAASGLILR